MAETSPPITTVASGRWTSAPEPCDSAIGMKPRLATRAVVMTGRSLTSAPSRTASRTAAALLAECVDVRHHHDPVQHGHAEERDEAHGRRDAERHAAQEQGEHAAHRGQRDAGEHEQRLPQRVERREEQQEDEEQRERARRSAGGAGPAPGSRTDPRTPRDSRAAAVTDLPIEQPAHVAHEALRCRGPRTLPSTRISRDPFTWLISAGPSISSIRVSERERHALPAGCADQDLRRSLPGRAARPRGSERRAGSGAVPR